jgi:hypothetical protein
MPHCQVPAPSLWNVPPLPRLPKWTPLLSISHFKHLQDPRSFVSIRAFVMAFWTYDWSHLNQELLEGRVCAFISMAQTIKHSIKGFKYSYWMNELNYHPYKQVSQSILQIMFTFPEVLYSNKNSTIICLRHVAKLYIKVLVLNKSP